MVNTRRAFLYPIAAAGFRDTSTDLNEFRAPYLDWYAWRIAKPKIFFDAIAV